MLWPFVCMLHKIFLRLNDAHRNGKFKMDYTSEFVNFFDTKVIYRDGHISNTFYRKPTDSLSFLHYSSFHPIHAKNSISFNQALRCNRNCSDPHDPDRHLSDFCSHILDVAVIMWTRSSKSHSEGPPSADSADSQRQSFLATRTCSFRSYLSASFTAHQSHSPPATTYPRQRPVLFSISSSTYCLIPSTS